MLIDAVLARNETDLVTLRTKYLAGKVDKMVICESPVTFAGQTKPLTFTEKKAQGELPEWVDVFVVNIPDKLVASGSHMDIEDYVRWEFLERLISSFAGARIIYQDVDEFPSPSQLENARTITPHENVVSIPMQIFYRRINWKLARKGDKWLCSKLILALPEKQNIRSIRSKTVVPGELGAHFSFLEATPEGLEDKLRHYPHQDVNVPAVWKPKYLEFCDNYGLDHLGRATDDGYGLLNFVPQKRFTTVMKFVASEHPEWVGDDFHPSPLSRLVAAQVATQFKESNGRIDFIEPDGQKMRNAGLLPATFSLVRAVAYSTKKSVGKRLRRTLKKLARLGR